MMIDYEKFRMFGEDSKAIRDKKFRGLRVENSHDLAKGK